jgi:hypothetical protein
MQNIGFPSFESVRVRFPLRSGSWTIWPDAPQNRWQWFVGHPLELAPMRLDFLDVLCDGDRLAIKPHYLESTWDTFFTDEDGCVEVQALGGLFPVTLGQQPELIAGIRKVLEALPPYLPPEPARKIEWISKLLFGAECRACVMSIEARSERVPAISGLRSLQASIASGVWRAKMGKRGEASAPITPPGAAPLPVHVHSAGPVPATPESPQDQSGPPPSKGPGEGPTP